MTELCDARAHLCRCHKDAGHVEAGDPIHACPPDRCYGKWIGEFDTETFFAVEAPWPVGEPRRWDTP